MWTSFSACGHRTLACGMVDAPTAAASAAHPYEALWGWTALPLARIRAHSRPCECLPSQICTQRFPTCGTHWPACTQPCTTLSPTAATMSYSSAVAAPPGRIHLAQLQQPSASHCSSSPPAAIHWPPDTAVRHCAGCVDRSQPPPADPVTSPTNLCCSPPTVPTGHAAPSPLAYEPQLTTAGPQDNANAKPSSAGQQGHRDPGCPARGRPAVLWPCPCLPYLLCAHRRCATHTC